MSSPDDARPLRERKKEATRATLLAAAEDLFTSQGYHATSMDEIAARADVSRATAFNYFPRKEAFLNAWVERRRDVVAELLTDGEHRRIDTASRLNEAFTALAARLEAHPDRNRALIRSWVEAGGPLLSGASATAQLFAHTIRHGQVADDIRPEIDPELAGAALLDIYIGALVRWSLEDGPPRALTETLLPALGMVIHGISMDRRPAKSRARAS